MANNQIDIRLALQGLSSVQSGINQLTSTFKHLAIGVAGAFAGYAGARSLTGALHDVISLGSNLTKLKNETSAPISKLIQLRQALDESGAGAESASTWIGYLRKQIVGAAMDGGATEKAFTGLGISLNEIRGMDAVDQLQLVGTRIAALKDPTLQEALAIKLLGKSGKEAMALFGDEEAMGLLSTKSTFATVMARNAAALDNIEDSLSRLKMGGTKFFTGLLDMLSLDKVSASIREMVDSIDFTAIGQKVGAWVAIAIDEWKKGRLGEFISLTIAAGFEIGRNSAVSIWNGLVSAITGANFLGKIATATAQWAASMAGYFWQAIETWLIKSVNNIEIFAATLENLLIKAFAAAINFFVSEMTANFNKIAVLVNSVTGKSVMPFATFGGVSPKYGTIPASKSWSEAWAESGKGRGDLYQQRVSDYFADGNSVKSLTESQDKLAAMLKEYTDNRNATASPESVKGSTPSMETGWQHVKVDTALGYDPDSFSARWQETMQALMDQWGTLTQQIANSFAGVINTSISSVSSNLTGVIMQTKTWNQALLAIGQTILSSIVEAIITMFTTWIVKRLLLSTLDIAASGREAAAAVPAAVAKTGATSGVNWVIGAALMAALAAGIAASLGAFKTGGYTGNFGVQDVAGIVHGKEFVMNADATSSIGLANLEAMNATGAMPMSGGGLTLIMVDKRSDADSILETTEGRVKLLDFISSKKHLI